MKGTQVGLNLASGEGAGSIISVPGESDAKPNEATALDSFAFGKGCIANNKRAIAMGNQNESHGNSAFTVGQVNKNYGNGSFVSGNGNTNYLHYSLMTGHKNTTTEVGKDASGKEYQSNGNIIGGVSNSIGATNSDVYGCFVGGSNNTIVSGHSNIVQGTSNEVSGSYNTVNGIGNKVQHSSRTCSLFGEYLISNNQIGQTIVGRYNEPISGATFVVANGSSEEDRKNAFMVLTDGRAKLQSAP